MLDKWTNKQRSGRIEKNSGVECGIRILQTMEIKKELKRISVTNKHGEAVEEKGNMDVEITIDALHHFKFKKSREKGLCLFFKK